MWNVTIRVRLWSPKDLFMFPLKLPNFQQYTFGRSLRKFMCIKVVHKPKLSRPCSVGAVNHIILHLCKSKGTNRVMRPLPTCFIQCELKSKGKTTKMRQWWFCRCFEVNHFLFYDGNKWNPTKCAICVGWAWPLTLPMSCNLKNFHLTHKYPKDVEQSTYTGSKQNESHLITTFHQGLS